MNEQLLKDFVATAEYYNYDWQTVFGKFPELQGYDQQVLKDYAATAKYYNYDYATTNSKFPEFSQAPQQEETGFIGTLSGYAKSVKDYFMGDDEEDVKKKEEAASMASPSAESSSVSPSNNQTGNTKFDSILGDINTSLIDEDDEIIAKRLREKLAPYGVNVTDTKFGREAIALTIGEGKDAKTLEVPVDNFLTSNDEISASKIKDWLSQNVDAGIIKQQEEANKFEKTLTSQEDFNTSMKMINPNFIDNDKDYVVPELKGMFGDYGFKFEEAGFGYDAIKVTAPNGKTLNLSIDRFTDKGDLESSNELKSFIEANKPKIDNKVTEYDKYYKRYRNQQEVDDAFKTIGQETSSLIEEQKQLAIDVAKLKIEREKLASNPNPEKAALLQQKQDEIAQRSSLIMEKENQNRMNEAKLREAVGKFDRYKEEEGTWYKITANTFLEEGYGIGAGLMNEGAYVQSKANALFNATYLSLSADIPFRDAWKISNAIGNVQNEEVAKGVEEGRKVLKEDINFKVSDAYKKAAEENFLARNALGVVGFAPALLASMVNPYAGYTAFFAGGYDGAMEEMNNSPAFKDVSRDEKVGMATALGFVNAAIMKYNVTGTVLESTAGKTIVANVLKRMGSEASAKTVQEFAENEVKSAIGRGLLTAGASVPHGFGMGAEMKLSGDLVKKIYNEVKENSSYSINGKQMSEDDFKNAVSKMNAEQLKSSVIEAQNPSGSIADLLKQKAKDAKIEGSGASMIKQTEMFQFPETTGEYLKQVAESGLDMAVGSLMMSSIKTIGTAYRDNNFNKVNDATIEHYKSLAAPEVLSAYEQSLNIKVANGEMTEAKKNQAMDDVRFGISVLDKMPDNLNAAQKRKAFSLIRERETLEQRIEGKDKSLVKGETERITEINKELEDVSKQAPAAPEAQPAKPKTLDKIEEGEVRDFLLSELEFYENPLKGRKKRLDEFVEEKPFILKPFAKLSREIVERLPISENKRYGKLKEKVEQIKTNPEQYINDEIERYEKDKEDKGEDFEYQPFLDKLYDLQSKLQEQNAIQKPTTEESVLRTEQPEVGLPKMGEGNAKETTTQEGVTPAKPEEVTFSNEELESLKQDIGNIEKQGTLSENLEGKVYRGNEEGNIKIEGQQYVFESNNTIKELGNVDEVGDSFLASFGLSKFPTEGVKTEKMTEGKKPNVVTIEGKEFTFLRKRKPENNKSVIVVKDNETGLQRVIKGDAAEKILKDISLQKTAPEIKLKLKTEGKPVVEKTEQEIKQEAKAKKREERINRKAEIEKEKAAFEAKTLEELTKMQEQLDKETAKFESDILETIAQESKKENKIVVKSKGQEFTVTKKADGEYSVSQKNEKGKFVGIKDEKTRNRVIKLFEKTKTKKDEARFKQAEELSNEFKKEQSDKFLSILDKAIDATSTKGKAYDASIGLPLVLTNAFLKVVRASYKGGKTLAEAIKDGHEFLKKQGYYNISEYDLKKYVLDKLGKSAEVKPTEVLKVKDAIITSEKTNNGGIIYTIIQEGTGKEIGKIGIVDKSIPFYNEGDYYQVRDTKINDAFQQKGYGSKVYEKIAESLDKPLVSDKELTTNAKKMWEGLVAKGVAEKNNDGYIILPTEVKPTEALKDVESTTKALDNILNDFYTSTGSDFADGTPNESRSSYAKMRHAKNRLEKKLGFDIGNVPNLSELQKQIKNSLNYLTRKLGYNGEFSNTTELSEAYQKAKADGSNPELVKAVEDLIGKPTQESIPLEVKVDLANIIKTRLREEGVSQEERNKLTGTRENPIITSATKADYESLLKSYKESKQKQLADFEEGGKEEGKFIPEKGIFISSDVSFYDNKIKAVEDLLGKPTEAKSEVDELLNLDTKDKTNLQKVYDFLDKADKDLTKFSKGTLGVNITIPAAKIIVKSLKALVKGGMKLQEAITKVAKENNVSFDDVVKMMKAVVEKPTEAKTQAKPTTEYEKITKVVDADVTKGKTLDEVLSRVEKSDAYKKLNDTEKEEINRYIKKAFGEKIKSAPSAKKILGLTENIKKITMALSKYHKDRYEDMEKAEAKKEKSIKNASKEVTESLKGLVRKGQITTKQMVAVLRKLNKTNVLSKSSVKEFTDYMSKVFTDAEYANKLSEARKLSKAVSKASKNKGGKYDANIVKLATEFKKIDPAMVEDIDQYNKMASELKSAIKGSTLTKEGPKFAETIKIADFNEYVEKTIEAQKEKYMESLRKQVQDLLGVDTSVMSYKEMMKLLEDNAKPKFTEEQKKAIINATKDMFEAHSDTIKKMLETGKDPSTGEDIDIKGSKKDVVERFMKMDTTKMDIKDAIAAVDALNNFIANQSTAKMDDVVSKYEGRDNSKIVKDKNIKSKPLRLYFSKGLGKGMTEQFVNLPMVFERLFKSPAVGAYVQKMMGVTDLINNKARAAAISKKAVNGFDEKFYKSDKKVNGENFNSSFNNIERYALADALRTIIGTPEEIQADFNRKKGLFEQSIEVLKKGNSEHKKKAELYQKVYDKIMKDSNSAEEVKAKADATNVEAVEYWIDKWAEQYDRLADVSENVYNKILDKDLNYTPVRMSKIKAEKPIDSDSAFHGNNGTIFKQKTGSLMEATRPDELPKNTYVDYSFDSIMANSFHDALVDIYTAADIRKVEAFIKSDSFEDIFPEFDDRDMLERRIQLMVRNFRNKNHYDYDELSKAMKYVNKLGNVGVGAALGGVFQPFKQTIPVAVNTLINAGDLSFKRFFDKENIDNFLDNSGYGIAIRGKESTSDIKAVDAMVEDIAKNAASRTVQSTVNGLKKLQKYYLKKALVEPDVAIARMSWITYYEKALKEQGKDVKNIDYSDHKINKEAADYAQRMVDRQQNISDADLKGKFFSNKDAASQIISKVLFPFASFRMNQSARLASDFITLTSKTTSLDDKRKAVRSLRGAATEIAMFNAVGGGLSALLYSGVKSLMADDNEDEEDKKKREEADQKYISLLKKGRATSAIQDLLSPMPAIDWYLQYGLYYTIDALNGEEEKGKEDEQFNILKPKARDGFQALGVLGIMGARAYDLIQILKMDKTGKFEDDYGNIKNIRNKDRGVFKTLVPLAMLNSAASLPAEFYTAQNIILKDIKKRASTKTETEIIQEKANKRERIANKNEKIDLIDQALTKAPNQRVADELVKMRNDAIEDLSAEKKSNEEKEALKKKREREKAEYKNLLGGYDTKEDLKRYDPDLYEDNFGEGSDYYKTHKYEQDAEKLLDKIERKNKDIEYNYHKPEKAKKPKSYFFNSDGTRKSYFKRFSSK